jgi:hypothetical protein
MSLLLACAQMVSKSCRRSSKNPESQSLAQSAHAYTSRERSCRACRAYPHVYQRCLFTRFELGMLTQDDNFAAHHVTARENETNITPENTREHIVNWLNECATHQCCPEQVNSHLPTRVIDVTALRGVTTQVGETGKYVALSYCWGSQSPVCFKSSTLDSFSCQMDLDKLPQTFLDAILITRSLSIPYLWVYAARLSSI